VQLSHYSILSAFSRGSSLFASAWLLLLAAGAHTQPSRPPAVLRLAMSHRKKILLKVIILGDSKSDPTATPPPALVRSANLTAAAGRVERGEPAGARLTQQRMASSASGGVTGTPYDQVDERRGRAGAWSRPSLRFKLELRVLVISPRNEAQTDGPQGGCAGGVDHTLTHVAVCPPARFSCPVSARPR
jgi:hypothetical protein